ncbi:putative phage repressor [Pseudogulbenkiania sp. NH8B]|uniref:XRE family transcriptional regulator n=1 Tax=Pseudogulbenkiania sp. (strain NH8B) TaxID=748280 RepID=UPI0002279A86|nr:S24 family peptidase [Pseudogulbenkiania sp. NH8B]BAK75800.1 putative phage repressor [Pseudogulbenkiania sp. NH8B]
MDTLAQRLAAARAERQLTQAQLARKSGVAQATIAHIESGRNKGSKHLLDLARALGVSAHWLDTGKGSMTEVSLRPIAVWEQEEELKQEGEYIFLPELTVRASAGPGTPIWHVDERGQKQAFTAKWARRMNIDPQCAATMVVDGGSMEPRLWSGDSIVVDYCQNETIIDGKVYVLLIDDEVKVKRLYKAIGGGLRITSDNPDKISHPDIVAAPEQMPHVKIIGRVVAVCGGM